MLLCLRHSRPPAGALGTFGLALISQAKRDKSGTICTPGKRSEEWQVFPDVHGLLVCARMCVRDSQALPPSPFWFPSTFFFFFQIRLCIQTDGSRLLPFFTPPPLPTPFNSLPLLTQTASPPHTSLTRRPPPLPPTVPV